jgi:hypothetical protein
VESDHGAQRLANERTPGIRREEAALIRDIVDVDVDARVLGLVPERGVCNQIGRDRIDVGDVAVAFPL